MDPRDQKWPSKQVSYPPLFLGFERCFWHLKAKERLKKRTRGSREAAEQERKREKLREIKKTKVQKIFEEKHELGLIFWLNW